jgi:tetratricopeptide (TPR) repeat protein
MSSLTEKPMARASAHLAAGRYAEAVGAFRAVLHIDPTEYRAQLGIADATAARGDRDGAIMGLLRAAETCGELHDPEGALALYGRVLVLDPNRIEVHLDIAFAESALGRHADAVARVEGLAEAYLRGGRSDEAEELFRFVANWEPEGATPAPMMMPPADAFGATPGGYAPYGDAPTTVEPMAAPQPGLRW